MNTIACPACGGILKPSHLEQELPCRICNRCGGCWLRLQNYMQWVRKNGQEEPCADKGYEVGEADTKRTLLCPETKTIMLKFRVSKNTDHFLDLSPHVGAVWMDKSEWGLLKREGLAYQLNSIFSDVWQAKIREARAETVFEKNYERIFGNQTYMKLKQIREWLYSQENPHLLLAYLNAENPYSVNK